jgi:hypothetical protein
MFIRWIERPHNLERHPYRSEGSHGSGLSCILAETKRIKGKPKQRHLAYLGGIRTIGIANDFQRCFFWDSVTAAFDRLHNKVKPEDRKRFEAAIAARVPRPSASLYKATARKSAQRVGWSFLRPGFKTALADEADKWKAYEKKMNEEHRREMEMLRWRR